MMPAGATHRAPSVARALGWCLTCLSLAACSDRNEDNSRRARDVLPEKTSPQSLAHSEETAKKTARTVPETASANVQPVFVDVARASGIDFTFFSDTVPGRYFLPEIMGGGIGWLDFDGDGRLDVCFRNGTILSPDTPPSGKHLSRLFRNLGAGQFADVTRASAAGLEAYGQGCAPGDYDADGFPDLYLANYGADGLLHNNGDGTFRDVTREARVSDELWSTSAVWCDLDGDHDLDLYVANYMNVNFETHKVCEYSGRPGYCGPGSFHSQPDAVYLNQGDGTFVESAAALGFVDEDGNGLAVIAADFDDDLVPEIFVANDMTPNHMFTQSTHFDAPGSQRLRYANVAPAGGSAVSFAGLNEAGMGIACADFDGDGSLDIFITHYYHMKNTLYTNRGRLIFDDDSRRTRIAATSYESLGFGTCPIDYDRDGSPDLFVANGHVLGPEQEPNAMRPQLLKNRKGQFSDVSDQAGAYFQKLLLGRGVAAADYDDDGDVDIAVSHLDQRVALLRNDTQTGRRWLGLDLATADRAPPVGGRVIVTTPGRRQVLPIVAGGSYLSSGDPRIVAGLPGDEDSVEVEILWPSGRVDRFTDLAADRYWIIREGLAPREQRRFE
ncbi:MAG: CRTAC1 family protein [Planctomycetia bacterium]|nr:CRTAC1 family protein [Planctomycetia bacterium]